MKCRAPLQLAESRFHLSSMSDDEQRYRLVVLGAGRVGKSSIVSRFLHGKFTDAYKPTVEDLHCRTLHADGAVIQVSRSERLS